MFKPYHWQNLNIGFARELTNTFVFFGNRNFTKAHFEKIFPQFEFRMLKQIHGATVIEAAKSVEVADGHFSKNLNEALVIQTADCMPILFLGDNQVAACHAGWRGLAANIVPTTAQKLALVQKVFIGPHIGKNSFEVGTDVAEEILKIAPTHANRGSFVLPHPDTSKRYIDLNALTRAQLQTSLPSSAQIESLDLDTKTDLGFHSYRRDGAKAERQYSFIVRLK